jgi:hypothetical protein
MLALKSSLLTRTVVLINIPKALDSEISMCSLHFITLPMIIRRCFMSALQLYELIAMFYPLNSDGCYSGPPLGSRDQSFWLLTQRSRVRFPALPDFSE